MATTCNKNGQQQNVKKNKAENRPNWRRRLGETFEDTNGRGRNKSIVTDGADNFLFPIFTVKILQKFRTKNACSKFCYCTCCSSPDILHFRSTALLPYSLSSGYAGSLYLILNLKTAWRNKFSSRCLPAGEHSDLTGGETDRSWELLLSK